MTERSVEIRKGSTNPSDIRLPFSYIQKQFGYPLESIVKQIHSEPVTHLGIYPNTFPNTIAEYYWISVKGSSVMTWASIGQLKNGLYYYYTAQTDKTFANGGGTMRVYFATRYSSLIQYAMDSATYEQYYAETVSLEDK